MVRREADPDLVQGAVAGERTGSLDVAVIDEVGIGVHAMDLHGNSRWPGGTELRHREAGVEQERTPCPRLCLCQLLRWQDAFGRQGGAS